MNSLNIKTKIAIYLGIIIILEFLSYASLLSQNLSALIFIIIITASLALTVYRLEYGLLVVIAELLVGSMGHLFMLHISDQQISIRICLWFITLTIFFLKFIGQIICDGKESKYLKALLSFSGAKYFIILAIFAFIGLINALLRGQQLNLIVSDFNSWLYWLLMLPAIVTFSGDSKKSFENLKTIFLSATIWLSLKTLILLYIFTHNLVIAPDVYLWLRKTLVGEMTPTLSGWPRIFIQGQIFSGVALFLTFWLNNKRLKNISSLLLGAVFSSALLISFSRSFWVALIVSIIFSLIIIWRLYYFKAALKSALWFAISFSLGLVLIILVAIFPYPESGKFNADFISRVSNGNEAALASRWSLLPILTQEIKKEPFFGQGFGATITYKSSDPRVLENDPSGKYTTYAFEWGYLDLWLKIGLFGLLAYLFLILYLTNKAIKYGAKNSDYLLLGLAASFVFLAITNIFTPYLNHPLGMGILLIGACLIRKDRVY
ncbi:MAG: O-antigen ligase family protein [Candidatus Falkowbacteria bacterium]